MFTALTIAGSDSSGGAGIQADIKTMTANCVYAMSAVTALTATVITPNIPEAEVLSEMEIKTEADMEKAAETICNTLGCAVLLKGGHQLNDANDLLFQKGKEPVWFHGKRSDNPNTHGTGCTLSSAIASNLAKGRDLETSVKYAKNYISGALADMLDLGKGSGPMNHAFAIEGEYER